MQLGDRSISRKELSLHVCAVLIDHSWLYHVSADTRALINRVIELVATRCQVPVANLEQHRSLVFDEVVTWRSKAFTACAAANATNSILQT